VRADRASVCLGGLGLRDHGGSRGQARRHQPDDAGQEQAGGRTREQDLERGPGVEAGRPVALLPPLQAASEPGGDRGEKEEVADRGQQDTRDEAYAGAGGRQYVQYRAVGHREADEGRPLPRPS
jgi:hypothetical protein